MPNPPQTSDVDPEPHLTEWRARTDLPTGLVLVLHGGQKESYDPTAAWQPAVLRMWPFAQAAHRAGRAHGVAVWSLRYRYRGWNADGAGPDRVPSTADTMRDAAWALDRVRERHGDLPVVLLGHSMGGRAALLAAGDPLVRGVVALAPWLPDHEPVEQLAGRTVLIAHGDREHRTDPTASYAYARRARGVTPDVVRFEVRGDGHAMLRRATDWHALATDFALGVLGVHPLSALVANALCGGHSASPEGLAVPLPRLSTDSSRPDGA